MPKSEEVAYFGNASQKPTEDENEIHKISEEHTDKQMINNKDLTEPWVFMEIPADWVTTVRRVSNSLDYDRFNVNDLVRTVLIAVLAMLIYTCAVVVLLQKALERFTVPMICLIATTVCATMLLLFMYYLMFFTQCARKSPWNYICLLITATSMAAVASFLSFRYNTNLILIAISITAVIVLVCLCIACTSFNFRRSILYLIVVSLVVFLLTLGFVVTIYWLKQYFGPLHIAVTCIFTLVNCLTLIIELQMMLYGYTIELGDSDATLGGFMLYFPILGILLNLINIVIRKNKR